MLMDTQTQTQTTELPELRYIEADFSAIEQIELPPAPVVHENAYDFLLELAQKISAQELYDRYLCDSAEIKKGLARLICDHIAPARVLYDYAAAPHPWHTWTPGGWVHSEKGPQAFIQALELTYAFLLMKEHAAHATVIATIEKLKAATEKAEKERLKKELRRAQFLAHSIHQVTAPPKVSSHFSGRKSIDELLMHCLAGSGTSRGIAIAGGWDEESAYTVPLKNGIFDIKKGIFRRYEPGDLVLTRADIDFDPHARCYLWEKTLSEIFQGNQQLIVWLQKFLGYVLTRDPKLDKVVFFYGPTGRNGKSLMANTLMHVLGVNKLANKVKAISILETATQSKNGPSPDALDMKGRALCVISELNKNAKLDIALLKGMTGRDTMSGRALYSPIIQKWAPSHTFLILTNHRPAVDAQDEAFWKRVLVVPFGATYSESPGPGEYPLDPDLEAKLKAESPGIMNWLLLGALEYMRDPKSLSELPEAVRTATAEYREAQDVLKDFLDDCCISAPGESVKSARLYDVYKKWCIAIAGQTRVASQKTLREQLAKKGITYKRSTTDRRYEGLRLRDDAELGELLGDQEKWK